MARYALYETDTHLIAIWICDGNARIMTYDKGDISVGEFTDAVILEDISLPPIVLTPAMENGEYAPEFLAVMRGDVDANQEMYLAADPNTRDNE